MQVVGLIVCMLAVASAESYPEGDERLGYVSVASDGATSITFNATSIQNAVILGLFVLVLGALILPLFGISVGSLFGSESDDTGFGYGYDAPAYSAGYEAPSPAGYNGFAKRSLEMVGPILDALSNGQKKYQ